MMSEYETSDEHRPVVWLRGYPVYAAHFIVLVFIVSMLVTVLMNLFKLSGLLSGLIFLSEQVLHGEVWRVVTYGLVNPMNTSDLAWKFTLDMAMIVWFGREVERHYGRRKFLIFYGVIYLITPLLFTLVGVWRPLLLVGETGAMAIFIAFATLYPRAGVFFGLESRWVAVVLVGVYTLIALSNRDSASLLSLWATTGFAFAFVRYQQGFFALPTVNVFQRRPKLRVLPDLESNAAASAKDARASSMVEIDALLDKIAQSGISSLTAKERAQLDAARAELLRRESGRR